MGIIGIFAASGLWTGCVPAAPDSMENTMPPTSVSEALPLDYEAVLETAVTRLSEARSYALHTSSIRAYSSELNGVTRTVYGEFIEDIRVRLDPLRVENTSKYRYGADEPFISETVYYDQEADRFHQRIVEADGGGTSSTVTKDEVFPYSSDILDAIAGYYTAAAFVEEQNGAARYVLTHPEWYRMKSTAMFADMGMLYMRDDAESAIEAYAREQYPDAAPIVFTIDVDIDSGYIRRITVDDGAFMLSIWEAVADAAIGQGAKPEELPRYRVLPENGTTYEFSRWNAVGEIEIPE